VASIVSKNPEMLRVVLILDGECTSAVVPRCYIILRS
jgi:hypothetical protein